MKWREEVFANAALDGGLISNDGLGTPGRTAGRRGEGVLQILKGWRQANIAAEYLESLVNEARKDDLLRCQEMLDDVRRQREDGLPGRMLLDDIEASLSGVGIDQLEGLTDAALTLNISPGTIAASSNQLSDVFMSRFIATVGQKIVLEDQLDRVRALQAELNADRANQTDLDCEKQDSTYDEQYQPVHAQTAQINRDTKQIALKIMEYEDRVKGLQRQLAIQRAGSVSVNELLAMRERNEEKKRQVKALQQQFAAFHGLPADLEASKGDVKRSINELEVLKARRQELFEKIGTVQ